MEWGISRNGQILISTGVLSFVDCFLSLQASIRHVACIQTYISCSKTEKTYLFHSRQDPRLGIIISINTRTQDDLLFMFVGLEKLLEVVDGIKGDNAEVRERRMCGDRIHADFLFPFFSFNFLSLRRATQTLFLFSFFLLIF